ncbi:MAG: glutamyl-tRNA reductase [Lachnospiraceae bacterium]|nr:glutamyl-tRNA reductase [Lachnospiraceae bacterium]
MNQIKMIGIDHNKASVEYREMFSFTKAGIREALEILKDETGIDGAVILSTCNRLELWISAKEGVDISLYDELCSLKHITEGDYRDLFVIRQDEEAITHLFETACGLRSKIIGDDQIISQVKDALSLSREVFCTDKVLETLFRNAIAAGKKVKTDVHLTNNDASAVTGTIKLLKRQGYDISSLTCMVIGNGEMGKLAANALIAEGADVTVTVRQYHHGQVQIPNSCSRINYGDRMDYLPYCDLVISATTSPNCTVKFSEFSQSARKPSVMLVDLAVPRDIDQECGSLDGVTLYDIDSFGSDIEHDKLEQATKEAQGIIQEYIKEFHLWLSCTDLVPMIRKVCQQAANDVDLRVAKPIRKLAADDSDKKELESSIEAAASKVVNKLLFGLRDHLDISTWRDCVEAASKIYEQ